MSEYQLFDFVVTNENAYGESAMWIQELEKTANGAWYGKLVSYPDKELMISANIKYILDKCSEMKYTMIYSNLKYVLDKVDPIHTSRSTDPFDGQGKSFATVIEEFIKKKVSKLKLDTIYRGKDFVVITTKSHNQMKKCRKMILRKSHKFTHHKPDCSTIDQVVAYRRMAIYDVTE
jgi:hypothetical protein